MQLQKVGIPRANISKGRKRIKNIIRKKNNYDATKVKKNDFERIEGGEVIRVRNRNKVKKGKIKFEMKIRRGRKQAKWDK